MLFTKKIDPRCGYCQRGSSLDETLVICPKKGVVSAGGHCRAFRYDPLKRMPSRPAAPNFEKLRDEDFIL